MMSYQVRTWDYTSDPGRKKELMDVIASTSRYVVIVNDSLDRFIVVGPHDNISIDEANVMASALNQKLATAES